jgi:glycosyltransferase involved in cell wall biosynthesis
LLDRWYVQTLMPPYARAADCILNPSETAREGLAQVLGVPLEKFVVTPEGAKDIFRERITPERLRQVRRKYELAGEFILHVGLIWGSKNFEVLPEVLELVNQRRPLLLVHAGKAERWGEGQGIASRFIRRTGFVPDEDLAALYQSALALVFPSIYEGFGIPIVEALASGCPVVTTNWGTMKEIAGDAALLVDARKPQEIADAVLRLATDPALRQELQSRGLERAKRFTWQETARLTLQAFRSLGDRPARTAGQTIGRRRLDERRGNR